MKKNKVLINLFLPVLLLSGCSTSGLIVQKEIEDRADNKQAYRILVIQKVTKDDIKDNTLEELLDMARDNNHSRTWFWVTEDEYNELEIGQKVWVYFGMVNSTQTSDPPLSGQNKIMILDR